MQDGSPWQPSPNTAVDQIQTVWWNSPMCILLQRDCDW